VSSVSNKSPEQRTQDMVKCFNALEKLFLDLERFDEDKFKSLIAMLLEIVLSIILQIESGVSGGAGGGDLAVRLRTWYDRFIVIILTFMTVIRRYRARSGLSKEEVLQRRTDLDASMESWKLQIRMLVDFIHEYVQWITLYGASLSTEVIICMHCGKRIFGKYVKVDKEKSYHRECFVCAKCEKPLQGKYWNVGGKVYCGDCAKSVEGGGAGEVCGGCGKEIEGEYLRAIGKGWHYDCFKCTRCSKVMLAGKKIFVADGKPLCEECAITS